MATLVSTHAGDRVPGTELAPREALKFAWYIWLAMLAVPFVFSIYVAWQVGDRPHDAIDRPFANFWFIGPIVYLLIAGPAAFFLRSRYFKGYWSGDCVTPRNYLIGMGILWATMVVGGLFAIAGCLFTQSLLPCMFPALVALVMFVIHWPSGRAMICGARGATDDPETYEEPR
jgi:hypothetical protein